MLVSYDPVARTIILRVNNPKTAGKYTLILSPNNFLIDWVRFPMIICHVNAPRFLFDPPDYSMKFRPNTNWKEYNVTSWPVVGGSEMYKCG